MFGFHLGLEAGMPEYHKTSLLHAISDHGQESGLPPEGPRSVTALAGTPRALGSKAVSDHQLPRLYFLGYWVHADFPM